MLEKNSETLRNNFKKQTGKDFNMFQADYIEWLENSVFELGSALDDINSAFQKGMMCE